MIKHVFNSAQYIQSRRGAAVNWRFIKMTSNFKVHILLLCDKSPINAVVQNSCQFPQWGSAGEKKGEFQLMANKFNDESQMAECLCQQCVTGLKKI